MMTTMTNIAVFVSGSGTNCENIIRYFRANPTISVSLVVSNRSDAFALQRAQRLHVPTAVVSGADFCDEDKMLPLLKDYRIDFIVLAGFLQKIPPFLIRAYEKRMINIHPALLPKYGGKGMYGHHVHEAVKVAGEKETGMTVHWVTEEYDKGEIIAQVSTPVLPEDTPEDIAEKEHVLEMEHFPRIIEEVIGRLH